MSYVITARDEKQLRIEGEHGEICCIGLSDENARILHIIIPDEEKRYEYGKALLLAAEGQAAVLGKKRMFVDVVDGKDNREFFAECGYRFKSGYPILSVDIEELLNSEAVLRVLDMDLDDVETEYLDYLMEYELMDVSETLRRLRYPYIPMQFTGYDTSLSCVAYDETHRLRAVLLAMETGDDILVNLLIGMAGENPKYVMSVCQAFARGLMSAANRGRYKKITLYAVNRHVVPLVKRALKMSVPIRTKQNTLHAKKRLGGEGENLPEALKKNISTWKWRDEMLEAGMFYQINRNNKHLWLDT